MMKPILFALPLLVVLSDPAAASNLIDDTYGAGVGSFEIGNFLPRGAGNLNFQSLGAGAGALTGWSIGGVGIDWLSEPYYGASDGIHAVDLGWYTGGAGSVSISLPTLQGATYALQFDAAAVSGFPTYQNAGVVTAGSLSASFAPAFSASFSAQTFHAQNYQFIAGGSKTVLTIAAAVAGTSYGPVIDNVSVRLVSLPVPEPESYALMQAGLGLVGVAMKRSAVIAGRDSGEIPWVR